MSTALQLLETLGRDATAELDVLLLENTLSTDVKAALQSRDVIALGRALGARPIMACSLAVPDREDEPTPQDDEGETPDSEERAA